MRLLQWGDGETVTLTGNLIDDVPQYAILSHTWGDDDQEVTYEDLHNGVAQKKQGYQKIDFCRKQAIKDGLKYFWIDSCCIKKSDNAELGEAIISMFRWYQNAKICYVYLSDVISDEEKGSQQNDPRQSSWKIAFRNSRWCTRGWTLQELLAPQNVEFFSKDGHKLGSKASLSQLLHERTGIPINAFENPVLHSFSASEKMSWARNRVTRRKEDKAYCLLGLLNISMRISYGEGEEHAMTRLRTKIERLNAREAVFADRKTCLLKSLDNGGPFTRVNNISKPSNKTFAWILGEEDSDTESDSDIENYFDKENYLDTECDLDFWERPRTGFLRWLRDGDGVFWFRGLPGSGKSTMMKFLAGFNNQNHKTLQGLKAWAAPRDPHILSFYFWLADTANIQNSLRGFLCHLLHQVLSRAHATFVSDLVESHNLKRKQTIANWDLEELEYLLTMAASQVAIDTPLCFFIDALDECKTDLEDVIRVIKKLINNSRSKIKFCISSRPEHRIQIQFRDVVVQSLELHTLTRGDIRKYVTDELGRCWEGNSASPPKEYRSRLINDLVDLSQGVFLWAFWVARRLRERIDEGDSIDQLEEELKESPRDMMELYRSILNKRQGLLKKSAVTKTSLQAEAASYFKFFINNNHLKLKHFGYDCNRMRYGPTLSVFVPLYQKYHGKVEANNPLTVLEEVKRRISNICAGLLIFSRTKEEIPDYSVHFLHRTAFDFFQEPDAMAFLNQSSLTQLESYCLLIEGLFWNGHNNCGSNFAKLEVIQMIGWCQEIREMSHADRIKCLQHIDNAMSQRHTSKHWVYRQEKSSKRGWDFTALDFTSLAFALESTELLSHYLSPDINKGRCLSGRYKDYLLLCSSIHINPAWRHKLLTEGANPNATFYWDLHDRLKTSPWLQYLIDTSFVFSGSVSDIRAEYGQPDINLDVDNLETFLENGASLDDRTLLLLFLGHPPKRIFRATVPELLSAPPVMMPRGNYLIVEVNAKFLLEEIFLLEKLRRSDIEEKIFSRLDVKEAKSYRRILACSNNGEFDPHPGELSWTPSLPFAEISLTDSERLLDSMKLLPCLGDIVEIGKLERIGGVWDASPKIWDIIQYLEKTGYYRPPDHPDILQGPIPMFEDQEETEQLT